MAYVSLMCLSQRAMEWVTVEADCPEYIVAGLWSSDSSSSQFCGGTGGYAVGPEPCEAGWAGGCVVPWGCVVAGGEPVCSWA